MRKPKLLCILHVPPPSHGASKVGEFIQNSAAVNEAFTCRFIPIRSSDTIADIGRINWKKIYFVITLYIKVLWALLVFRPDKIYFTASVRSVAFYRDLLLSTLWKVYGKLTSVEVYYHYHTKGIDDFVSVSPRNLWMTRFFLRGVNLVLLSPMLVADFQKAATYKSLSFLPNGVEDPLDDDAFETVVLKRYADTAAVHVLYLSNMIRSKGCFELLNAAVALKGRHFHFHFAGGWQRGEDEKEFFEIIELNGMRESVTFHGFVGGERKRALFEQAHLFVFPTRYPNEAFPLSLLEALSYGVPCIATDEGSIPYILDERCGVVLEDTAGLGTAILSAADALLGAQTARYCREHYLGNFTMPQFERNFIRILHGQN